MFCSGPLSTPHGKSPPVGPKYKWCLGSKSETICTCAPACPPTCPFLLRVCVTAISPGVEAVSRSLSSASVVSASPAQAGRALTWLLSLSCAASGTWRRSLQDLLLGLASLSRRHLRHPVPGSVRGVDGPPLEDSRLCLVLDSSQPGCCKCLCAGLCEHVCIFMGRHPGVHLLGQKVGLNFLRSCRLFTEQPDTGRVLPC